MTVREAWAAEFRRARKSWDLSREDVARMVGASVSSVRAWETAARSPEPESLARLVKALDIDPRALFTVDVEIRDVA